MRPATGGAAAIDITAYAHVIWDWNGTLLDDVALCVDIANGILRRRSRQAITLDQYHEAFDFPVAHYYTRLGFAIETFPALTHEFYAAYDDRIGECALHREAHGALQRLADAGIAQSVLSSMEQDMLDRMLARFGIDGFFSTVIGQSDRHASGKIESGRRLLDDIACDRAAVLLIGDTLHDHEVATALGIDCALIAHGHHSRGRLEATARPITDSLHHLLGR